jgi:hypothetical protein
MPARVETTKSGNRGSISDHQHRENEVGHAMGARTFLVPPILATAAVICAHREPPPPIVIQLPALAK